VQAFEESDGLSPFARVVQGDGVDEAHANGARGQIVRSTEVIERRSFVAEPNLRETQRMLQRSAIAGLVDASFQEVDRLVVSTLRAEKIGPGEVSPCERGIERERPL
jgi:hypothetical protein